MKEEKKEFKKAVIAAHELALKISEDCQNDNIPPVIFSMAVNILNKGCNEVMTDVLAEGLH